MFKNLFHKRSLIWEVLRKTIHLSGLLIVLAYTLLLYYFSMQVAILALTALLLLQLEIEYMRLEHMPEITKMFGGMVRKHERNGLAASVFLVISCIICFSAFDYWIALVAMFMAVFGDFFAALMGRFFGKTKILKNKTIIGTLSGFAANALVGLFVLSGLPLLAIAMAFTASLVELLTGKLDDNLTVPLFAGFAGQMLVYLFNIHLPPLVFTLPGIF